MPNDSFFLFVRFVFSGLFVATILIGFYLWRNYERLFGVDPNLPSENSSATLAPISVVAAGPSRHVAIEMSPISAARIARHSSR